MNLEWSGFKFEAGGAWSVETHLPDRFTLSVDNHILGHPELFYRSDSDSQTFTGEVDLSFEARRILAEAVRSDGSDALLSFASHQTRASGLDQFLSVIGPDYPHGNFHFAWPREAAGYMARPEETCRRLWDRVPTE